MRCPLPLVDATACDLSVGADIVPNPLQNRPGEFLDVWPNGNALLITNGKGDERVVEQFAIKSAEVMPYVSRVPKHRSDVIRKNGT